MRIFLALLYILFCFSAEAQTTRRIQSSDVTGALGYTPIASIQGMTGVMTCGTGLLCSGQVLSVSGVPIGNVSGLGTGVGTALSVNIGSAGSMLVNGGVLGTPSSGTATNLTGTASGLTAGNVTTNANLTGDVTSVGNATTLATVNANIGSFGNATSCVSFTTNAKGLITAASATACTPAIGSITGLGTGVGTFLVTPSSANLRSAMNDETGTGFLYFQGGDIGTPSAGVATNITALNATQLTTGTIPAARTNGHQNGTATNDNAAAGEIGEYSSATLINASAISLTNNTAANVISISLTAGDWDVSGVIIYTYGGSTVITQELSAISTTSASMPSLDSGQRGGSSYGAGKTGGAASYVHTPSVRISINTTTTVYLIALGLFTTSSMNASGIISARRIR